MAENFEIKKKYAVYIRLAVSVLIVTVMVFVSEIFNEPEIVFPEIAALAMGGIISEKTVWKVNRKIMFLLMSISAFLGYFLAMAQDIPIVIRIAAAILICCAALLMSKTTMLPMISASVLPILTNAKSIIYPLSVIILTGFIIGMQILTEKFGLRQKCSFTPLKLDKKVEFSRWVFLFSVIIIMSAAAVFTDNIYIIAPPLIVAFCEFSYTKSNARKSPVSIVLIIVFCAFTGAFFRISLCGILGFEKWIAAGIAALVSMYVLMALKKTFPPAAALAVLPFIIPFEIIYAYPFEVTVGAAVFITSSMFYGKLIIEKVENRKNG